MSVQMHVISGFVGGTPEIREVQGRNGTPQTVTTMSVAVNNPRARDAEPTWYRVTMWNGLGTTVAKYVDKSDFVVVTAEKLAVSTWLNQDNNPQYTLEITASSVDFSSNRRNGESANDEVPENSEDMPF
jgi:single-stranded DNA-binding protein